MRDLIERLRSLADGEGDTAAVAAAALKEINDLHTMLMESTDESERLRLRMLSLEHRLELDRTT